MQHIHLIWATFLDEPELDFRSHVPPTSQDPLSTEVTEGPFAPSDLPIDPDLGFAFDPEDPDWIALWESNQSIESGQDLGRDRHHHAAWQQESPSEAVSPSFGPISGDPLHPLTLFPDDDAGLDFLDTEWRPSIYTMESQQDINHGVRDVSDGQGTANVTSIALDGSAKSPDSGAHAQTVHTRQRQTRAMGLRKRHDKVRQRQLMLMRRGIGRTKGLSAQAMPLGYLNSLISQTADAGHSMKYEGYAIHETRDADGRRSYRFLDPDTAMSIPGGTLPLLQMREHSMFDLPDLDLSDLDSDQQPRPEDSSTDDTHHNAPISSLAAMESSQSQMPSRPALALAQGQSLLPPSTSAKSTTRFGNGRSHS